jgi:ketosteroid isomerase-like protein
VHPSERLVRDFFEAHSRHYQGSDEDLAGVLADDIRWHVPGRSAIAGDYEGIPAVLAYFDRRRDHARSTFRITVRDVLAGEEVVAVLADGEAKLRGATRTWRTVGLYRIAAGKIAEVWLLPFDQYQFDEIWS